MSPVVTERALRRTEAFYDFEVRGRGWVSYPYSVPLEPPFRFLEDEDLDVPHVDDSRQPSLWGEVKELFGQKPSVELVPTEPKAVFPPEELPPAWFPEEPLDEFRLLMPQQGEVSPNSTLRFLSTLVTARLPISFELIGTKGSVEVLVSCRRPDTAHVKGGLQSFFPDVVVTPAKETLRDRWGASDKGYRSVLEFGLRRECMLPLSAPQGYAPDPLTPFIAALASVSPQDIGLIQVLFTEVHEPWASAMLRAVVTSRGEPFFADAPEITTLTQEKVKTPLYAVVLRLAAQSGTEGEAWETVRRLAGGLAQFSSINRNAFTPLAAEDIDALEEDVLARTTHRSGMLLSGDELGALVHLPSSSIRIPALTRASERTKASPPEARKHGVFLGENEHQGEVTRVHLGRQARLRHTHVIGASGTGKSTLLQSLILQDIERGDGVGVIDPHGDMVETILGRIPENRLDDVVLFDPTDEEYTTGWNILQAKTEVEKQLLASDLVSVFRRLSTSWGDQMTSVLANAIMVFLESTEGGTLVDLRRFLIDKKFRAEFLKTVPDEHTRSYWENEFPLLASRRPEASILTRLDTFLRSKLVRRVVTAPNPKLDFREVVDSGRIFLAKLAQGAIGEENAALLGSLLVSKIHQVVLSRADIDEKERRPFFLVLDEFHELATASMATIFSGARKFGLGLTVAHQDMYQLKAKAPEVERAVLGNAYTRICFRVGDEDAKKLAHSFSFYGADELVDLGLGEAICRIGRAQNDFNLKTFPLPEVDAEEVRSRRAEARARSRERWGTKVAIPLGESSEEPSAPRAASTPQTPQPAAPPSPPARRSSETTRAEEPEQQPTQAPAAKASASTAAPSPGRGGPQHKYLQGVVKQWGEAQGFRAEIEHELQSGGRVDVALIRPDLRIAVEIAVSSTSEQEVANVRKCLEGGFGEIVVLSLRRKLLAQLGKALDDVLSKGERAKVQLLAPEELAAVLEEQAPVSEETVAGYKVKVKYGKGRQPEAGKRAVADVILKSLRRLRDSSRA